MLLFLLEMAVGCSLARELQGWSKVTLDRELHRRLRPIDRHVGGTHAFIGVCLFLLPYLNRHVQVKSFDLEHQDGQSESHKRE